MVNPSKLSLKHATVIVVVFRDRSFSVGGISGGGGGGGDMEKGRTKESLQGEAAEKKKEGKGVQAKYEISKESVDVYKLMEKSPVLFTTKYITTDWF